MARVIGLGYIATQLGGNGRMEVGLCRGVTGRTENLMVPGGARGQVARTTTNGWTRSVLRIHLVQHVL